MNPVTNSRCTAPVTSCPRRGGGRRRSIGLRFYLGNKIKRRHVIVAPVLPSSALRVCCCCGGLGSAGKAGGIVALSFQVRSHSLHDLGHGGVDVIDRNIGNTGTEASMVQSVVGSLRLEDLVLFLRAVGSEEGGREMGEGPRE
jgi:hypothetical protein